jgi:hypothetical protein
MLKVKHEPVPESANLHNMPLFPDKTSFEKVVGVETMVFPWLNARVSV